ncbi:MAG TPA: alpha/beta hydrolase [Anaeromyxobacter sp.]|nr:alpha/beta hydrolase [Anaeromyxobacter sp.]
MATRARPTATAPPRALLLPGLDGSGRLFGPLLEARPRAFRPEVLSYPPDEPLGYDDLAALVRRRLPRGRFVLLAESFSGPAAVRVAAARPPGLEALILAATFLHAPLNPLLHPIRGVVGARFFGVPMPAAVVRWFMAGNDAPAAIVREVQQAVAAVSPEVLAHRSAEALRVDVRGDLVQVDAPLLVLAPTRDRLLRTDVADEILALRPDAEVALVDAPHMVLQRCPHASLARIEEFLARPGARAGSVG